MRGVWLLRSLLVLFLLKIGEAQDLPAYIEPRLPECAFHVFRHISKTGGTTVRFIFDRQTVYGEWEYPLIYGFKQSAWDSLLARWKEAAEEWENGGKEAVRVLVEVRGNWPENWPAEHFLDVVLPDTFKLKEQYGPKGCEVTTSFLMRDPLEQYLSFYHYYIKKLQVDDPQDAARKPSDPKGPAAFGKDAAEWAANVPDMQVREVLGTKCTPQMRQAGYAVRWQGDEAVREGAKTVPKQCQVRDKEYQLFRQMITRMDVVGITSDFDAFLLMLAHKVGLQHPQYIKSNTGKHEKRKDKLEAAVVATIEEVTQYDQRALELVASLQRDQIRDAGPEFAERLRLYKESTTTEGNRKFVGGKPLPAPYKWVDQKDGEEAGVERFVPPFFTEETGGGQATAYIYFNPVMLVERADAPSLRCIKGCNFDP